MPRLFVAAWPDASTVQALRQVSRPDEPGVRWVPESNWHITVRFLGDCDIDEVQSRLSGASLPLAHVRLGPNVTRLDRRQIVVPADGAAELAAAVDGAVVGVGEARRHPFVGHLTIARTKPGADPAVIGHPIGAEMTVAAIVLVSSTLLPTGAEYRTIAEYPTV